MHRLLVAVVIVAALEGLFLAGCGGSADTAESPTATAAKRPTGPQVIYTGVRFREVEPEAMVEIGASELGMLAATEDFLWLGSSEGIYRIDPETRESKLVLAKADSFALAADETSVWATYFDENLVRRIDASSGQVETIEVGINPEGIAVTDDAVWVANHRGGDVTRIDPVTNRVVASVTVGPKGPSGPQNVGAGAGSIWVGVPSMSAVVRLDPGANKVQKTIDVDIPGVIPCGHFAVSETDVWLSNCDGITLLRLDARTNEPVAVLSIGVEGGFPILVNDDLWVSVRPREGLPGDDAPGGLVHIDRNNKMVDAVALGEDFAGGDAIVAFGSLWVTDFNGSRVLRVSLDALGD